MTIGQPALNTWKKASKMTNAAHPSPLTGTLGLMPTLAELTATPIQMPAWAKAAVEWTDDDVTVRVKFFRTRAEARRWAGACDHPTSVILGGA